MTRELIAQSKTPDGESLTLTKEDEHHVVRVRGELLMSSRQTGSEEALAQLAFDKADLSKQPKVLVGGLGIGFTLRAILDLFGAQAHVSVVELLPDVVSWNRGVLAAYADHALSDPRVTVIEGDLVKFLGIQYLDGDYLEDDQLIARKHAFDAIVLDLDNGPEPFTVSGNSRLYSTLGLVKIYEALKPGGVMVLWSAFKSPAFEKSLRKVGFTAESVVVRARTRARKGARHTVFVGTRPI